MDMEEYWGLKEPPFENVPDPRFFYAAPQHEEALTRLIYAASRRKGAAMLTGDVGCGKTLLSRVFIQGLSSDRYEVALIVNPVMNPLDLIREVIYQFGIKNKYSSKTQLLRLLNTELAKNLQRQKDSVIIVDEAQAIRDLNTFEELRLLLNFQLNDRFLCTLILFGQPELLNVVRKIPQLEQRIAIKYHIRPFNLEETLSYINIRLRKAGTERMLLSEKAMQIIHQYSQGVPRKINNLCDLALLVGFSSKVKVVDESLILRIIDDGRG